MVEARGAHCSPRLCSYETLLREPGVFGSLDEGTHRRIHIAIRRELNDNVAHGSRPRWMDRFARPRAQDHGIGLEILGRRLEVGVKLAVITICAGTDRALVD